MLWYKAWLEMRWRMLMLAGTLMLVEGLMAGSRQHPIQVTSVTFAESMRFLWLLMSASLAGCGARTESPFRPIKGAGGSMYFTLSLPVSRWRLLATRVAMGVAGSVAVLALGCIFPVVFQNMRQQISAATGLQFFAAAVGSGLAGYGVSTVLATVVMDQQWQVFLTMGTLYSALHVLKLPESIDFLSATGRLSPIITGRLPAGPIAMSVGICAMCLVAAAVIEARRDY